MARYYLVPFETDKEIKEKFGFIDGQCPKYFDELGNARGIISLDEDKKPYYIIIIDDKQDMSKLESHIDIKKLDSRFKKTDLQSIGIDISTMRAIPTEDEIEQKLTEWLIRDSRTLRTL